MDEMPWTNEISSMVSDVNMDMDELFPEIENWLLGWPRARTRVTEGCPMLRRIWIADHRGRDAVVVLVPRQRTTPVTTTYVDGVGTPVRFSRRIKATDRTSHTALREGYRDPEALARALINSDPEVDLDAVTQITLFGWLRALTVNTAE